MQQSLPDNNSLCECKPTVKHFWRLSEVSKGCLSFSFYYFKLYIDENHLKKWVEYISSFGAWSVCLYRRH